MTGLHDSVRILCIMKIIFIVTVTSFFLSLLQCIHSIAFMKTASDANVDFV